MHYDADAESEMSEHYDVEAGSKCQGYKAPPQKKISHSQRFQKEAATLYCTLWFNFCQIWIKTDKDILLAKSVKNWHRGDLHSSEKHKSFVQRFIMKRLHLQCDRCI